jgi:hypothetical protein
MANQKTVKTDHFETPQVDGRKIVATHRRRIQNYERRHEVSSDDMLRMVSVGKVRETAEILKWMQAYHVLRLLKPTTRTDGIHTTTTEQSTRNA